MNDDEDVREVNLEFYWPEGLRWQQQVSAPALSVAAAGPIKFTPLMIRASTGPTLATGTLQDI